MVRVGDGVPWVAEPQNLNERKREKEERRRPTFFPSSFFSFYYFLALVPRVVMVAIDDMVGGWSQGSKR